jgi:hypothetical protein
MIRCEAAAGNRAGIRRAIMRVTTVLALGASAVVLVSSASAPASADSRNPDGVGIYTPAEPPVRNRPRLYRYDPNSWYYNPRGYYPNYASGYWVPRAEMRYRYRYVYRGPQYRYYPAWGYGVGSYSRWW